MYSIIIHGCTKQNKSREPKYLTKTDAHPNPNITRTKNIKEICKKCTKAG